MASFDARPLQRAGPELREAATHELLRTHVYSRFIPREELGAFAPWTPGAIAGGAPPQSNVRRAPLHDFSAAPAAGGAATAPPTSSNISPNISATPPPAAAAEATRAVRHAGYQDGYRDGLLALEGFKKSNTEQTAAQIGALLESLGSALAGLQQDMARTLAITATNLARQIVRAELCARPELVARVAQEALDTLLLSARHITLRVHPDDHPLVAVGAADVLAARGTRLLADASVLRGGCQVESDIGVIDASLDTRWRRAAASIGVDAGWDALEGAAGDDAEIDTDFDADFGASAGAGVDTDLGAYADAAALAAGEGR